MFEENNKLGYYKHYIHRFIKIKPESERCNEFVIGIDSFMTKEWIKNLFITSYEIPSECIEVIVDDKNWFAKIKINRKELEKYRKVSKSIDKFLFYYDNFYDTIEYY